MPNLKGKKEETLDPRIGSGCWVKTSLSDHPKEECGVFGIFNHAEASNLTYLGLYALQHRGQESAGIV
ncbi:MAG: hypothetical protein Q7V48_05900, partial [Deltaproteobacteria bacterium]|nr:hypothetical protein [Deltaproteobacteria bacterium]